jgi:membrane-bound lytic murein transglycosylase D
MKTNWIKNSGLIIMLICLSGSLIFSISNEDKNKITHEGSTYYFPSNVDFSGEKMPLEIADVKERFDRELLVNANLHASTILIIKRANRAFKVIEPILEKNGVPNDFKYLAVIESSLINAVSPSGAKGVWQFMPATAKEIGMEVNECVDERYHLEKSTEAACKFLLAAKEKFGSWTLAAASYNGGIAGVIKQIELQKVSNYYDLLLNEETSRYVFRILALKEIMKAPEKFGFEIPKQDLYEGYPTRKLEIDTTVTNLADFAIRQGVNYKILKLYNPWLRDSKLENKSRKKYWIELPK